MTLPPTARLEEGDGGPPRRPVRALLVIHKGRGRSEVHDSRGKIKSKASRNRVLGRRWASFVSGDRRGLDIRYLYR
jgi:hypothetical protein